MGLRYLQFQPDVLHRLDARHLLRYTVSLRVNVWENQAKSEKAERWSAKLFHTNIIDRLGGLMDKFTKVYSSSVLV